MKYPLKLYLIAISIGFVPAQANQSQDTGSLGYYLAYQCSASSGNPVEGYLEYGAKLEKTLNTLTPEQQAIIFGFELPSAHNAVNKAGNTNGSGGSGESQTELPPEEQPTLLDRLLTFPGG